jgi:hypothetical protein
MKWWIHLCLLGLAAVAAASPWPVAELKKVPLSQELPDKAVEGVMAKPTGGRRLAFSPITESRKLRTGQRCPPWY